MVLFTSKITELGKIVNSGRYRVYFFKEGKPHFSKGFNTWEKAKDFIKSQHPSITSAFAIVDIKESLYYRTENRVDWSTTKLRPLEKKVFGL